MDFDQNRAYCSGSCRHGFGLREDGRGKAGRVGRGMRTCELASFGTLSTLPACAGRGRAGGPRRGDSLRRRVDDRGRAGRNRDGTVNFRQAFLANIGNFFERRSTHVLKDPFERGCPSTVVPSGVRALRFKKGINTSSKEANE